MPTASIGKNEGCINLITTTSSNVHMNEFFEYGYDTSATSSSQICSFQPKHLALATYWYNISYLHRQLIQNKGMLLDRG